MNILYINKGSSYFSLEYTHELMEPDSTLEQKLIIPNGSFEIYVDLHLNGKELLSNNYEGLSESIGNNCVRLQIWKDLGYNTSLFIDDKHSFVIRLYCSIFSAIKNELGNNGTCNDLKSLSLKFDYLTNDVELQLSDVLNGFNYLLSSLFLNLEYKFPLVFSFYGRSLFKLNYNWIIRSIHEILDFKLAANYPVPLSNELEKSVENVESNTSRQDVLNKTLKNLQSRILSEFNSLNIWKEYEGMTQKFKAYKQQKLEEISGTSNLTKKPFPVKNMVYSLHLLDLPMIEANIGSDTIHET